MAQQFIGDSSGEESATPRKTEACSVCELSPVVGHYRSKPLGAQCGLAVRSALRQLKDDDEKREFNENFDQNMEQVRPALKLLHNKGGKRGVGARNAVKAQLKASDIPIYMLNCRYILFGYCSVSSTR